MSSIFVQRCVNATVKVFACRNGAETDGKIYHIVMRWLTHIHMFILSSMGECLELIYYHDRSSDASSHVIEDGTTE